MDPIGRVWGVSELGRMETLQERKVADETNREGERETEEVRSRGKEGTHGLNKKGMMSIKAGRSIRRMLLFFKIIAIFIPF